VTETRRKRQGADDARALVGSVASCFTSSATAVASAEDSSGPAAPLTARQGRDALRSGAASQACLMWWRRALPNSG